MSHVICEPAAATVIKTYSPNLMVHPLMRQSAKSYPDDAPPAADSGDAGAAAAAKPIIDMLPRLHALVVGPGLGRDPTMQAISKLVVREAVRARVALVLDADGLMLVNADPGLVAGCETCVLTPNVVEFGRLARALGVEVKSSSGNGGGGGGGGAADTAADCVAVSKALGGVLVVQKGREDYISNGAETVVCDLEGGLKRAGGQGDTLTGSIATMLAWRSAYHEGLWETEGGLGERETLMLAAFGGAAITRECSRLAFKQFGRALQASDVGDQVPKAFMNLIGEKGQAAKI